TTRLASHALDHVSHAFQGPHSVGIAVGFSALGERCFDLGQLRCDLGWTDALFEQVRGTHPSLFHRRKITPRTYSPATRPGRMLLIANSWGGTHPLVFAPTPTLPVVAAYFAKSL